MPIKYSLSARPTNPSDKNAEKRVYPMAQYSELVDLNEFARHIQAHGSPFTRDVITGVLTAAVDCLREQLVAGKKVNFGEMGAFYLTLRSDGVEDATTFDPSVHVKNIYVHWERSKFFADLKGDKDLKWEYTLTRKEMAEAKKESKQEATEAAGGGSNSGGGGSGWGDPGDITE
ncbi:MAG: DNA-binding protein [Bacteroidaceae bacterium]|nr:DNA-binding protein [Bacteroidaceae bacterium]MBQ8969287.1 DNA-binding protein [Bacteroidaceae bacterium]